MCDIDLDPVMKLDLDTVVIFLHAENEVNRSRGSKTRPDRQTCKSFSISNQAAKWHFYEDTEEPIKATLRSCSLHVNEPLMEDKNHDSHLLKEIIPMR